MADIEYISTLDNKQVLKALKQIEAEAKKTAQSLKSELGDLGVGKAAKSVDAAGDKIIDVLGRIEKEAKETNRALKGTFKGVRAEAAKGFELFGGGGLGGATTALIEKFIELGQVAAEAFLDIAVGAVELNSNLEQATVTFANVFGSTEDAEAFVSFLRQTSTELGVSTDAAIGFAKSLVPDTQSQEQFNELLRVGATIARDAGKSLDEVRFSFEEAISGQFESLKGSLGVTGDQIRKIKELAPDLGIVPALIQVLDERFEKSGVQLETFADTFDATVDRATSRAQDLQASLGVPIFEELKEQVSGLGEILAENADDFALIAEQIGAIAAEFVKLGGENIREFLESLDTDEILDFLLEIQNAVEAGKLFVTEFLNFSSVLFEIQSSISPINILLDAFGVNLEDVVEQAGGITGILISLAEVLARAEGAWKGMTTTIIEFIEALLTANQVIIAFAVGDFTGGVELATQAVNKFSNAFEEGQKVGVASFAEFQKRLEETNKAMGENTQAAKDRKAAMEEAKNTTVDFTNTLLGQRQAEEALAKAQQEAADALSEISDLEEDAAEKRTKIADDLADKLANIELDTGRKRLDAARDASRKREDIARNSAQNIENIRRKNADAIEDAQIGLGRKEKDLAKKQADDRANLEKDSANKRADIERDFQRELADIQSTFEESATEAIRERDAVAFLRAQEKRDKEVQEAEAGRTESIDDLQQETESRRQELAQRQADERAQLEEENARKLEDLALRLERELEAEATKTEQALEAARIAEERKSEDINLQEQRRIEDAQAAADEKLANLEQSTEKEKAAVLEGLDEQVRAQVEAELDKTKAAQDGSQERIKIAKEEARAIQQAISQTTRGGRTGAGGRPRIGGALRQFGGPVTRGQRVKVGEAGIELFQGQQRDALLGIGGPEIFFPPSSGNIVSNDQLIRNIMPQEIGNAGTVQNIERTINAEFGLIDQNQLTAQIEFRLRNSLLQTLQELQ